VKLAVGSGTQTVLPLPDLGGRGDVMAVDTADNVCGANGGAVYSDGGCCIAVHVVKSAAGSNAPTVLPFKPVNDIGGMAVDTFGDVYVGDGYGSYYGSSYPSYGYAGYGYPSSGYAGYSYPSYGYGSTYLPGYRVARRVAIHRARWR